MKKPDVAARLDKMALLPQLGSPAEFTARRQKQPDGGQTSSSAWISR
jgi:hypothetical protein